MESRGPSDEGHRGQPRDEVRRCECGAGGRSGRGRRGDDFEPQRRCRAVRWRRRRTARCRSCPERAANGGAGGEAGAADGVGGVAASDLPAIAAARPNGEDSRPEPDYSPQSDGEGEPVESEPIAVSSGEPAPSVPPERPDGPAQRMQFSPPPTEPSEEAPPKAINLPDRESTERCGGRSSADRRPGRILGSAPARLVEAADRIGQRRQARAARPPSRYRRSSRQRRTA